MMMIGSCSQSSSCPSCCIKYGVMRFFYKMGLETRSGDDDEEEEERKRDERMLRAMHDEEVESYKTTSSSSSPLVKRDE